MVVGGGNAAADCAIALAESQLCKSVSLSYRRQQLARLRGSVRKRLEELMETRHVVAYLGTELDYIAPDHVALKGKEKLRIANDHVIVQIGGTSPSELLKTVGIQLVEKRGVA